MHDYRGALPGINPLQTARALEVEEASSEEDLVKLTRQIALDPQQQIAQTGVQPGAQTGAQPTGGQ
jgi:hypothetical protein